MDSTHVVIKPPPNSGSVYFNYKHTFSIVPLAVANADYYFLYVAVAVSLMDGLFKTVHASVLMIACDGVNVWLCLLLPQTHAPNVRIPVMLFQFKVWSVCVCVCVCVCVR